MLNIEHVAVFRLLVGNAKIFTLFLLVLPPLAACLVFEQGQIPAPAFHAFTGTEFTSPNAMHGALWRAINGARGGEEGIGTEKKLENKLKYWRKKPTATSPMLVVVLDEIDQLMTENRQVLRKLFQWADAPKSRLVSYLYACLVVHTKSLSGRHSTWALLSLFARCLGRPICMLGVITTRPIPCLVFTHA